VCVAPHSFAANWQRKVQALMAGTTVSKQFAPVARMLQGLSSKLMLLPLSFLCETA